MAFTPKAWVDGTAGGTPITAAELNRIEDGIDEAHEEISTLPTPPAAGTAAQLTAGTDTAQRTWSAKDIADYVATQIAP